MKQRNQNTARNIVPSSIARVIRKRFTTLTQDDQSDGVVAARYELHALAQDLAVSFSKKNPRVSIHSFLRACGMDPNR